MLSSLEGIIKLIRREVNIMGKPILLHTITANSEEEVDRLSHEWFKEMRGKIEVLDTKSSEYRIKPAFLNIEYYYLDNPQVEFTLEELEYIAEHFHDELKDQPENKVLQSIEEKAEKALGWR
jgi:hypothetical protein